MTVTTVQMLIRTVKEMRYHQVKYFKFRDPRNLNEAIRYEMVIDKMLKDFEGVVRPDVQQMTLFELSELQKVNEGKISEG